jgi:hypothetical protein
MKKDISFLPVQGVKVAVVRRSNETTAYEWLVCLLNESDQPICNVLVTSKGYGYTGEEKQLTSTLRHGLGDLEPNSYAWIEMINPDVFHLSNEYWVSYYIGEHIYDKKFIFVPGSINEDNFSLISLTGLEGVLHE